MLQNHYPLQLSNHTVYNSHGYGRDGVSLGYKLHAVQLGRSKFPFDNDRALQHHHSTLAFTEPFGSEV